MLRPLKHFVLWYLSAACGVSLVAGPYSLGLGDESNTFDAPVPGWVGPAGDGKSPRTGSGNEANYLNPVFTGWATTVVDYQPIRLFVDFPDTPNPDFIWQFSGEATDGLIADYDLAPVVSLGEPSPAEIASGQEPGFIVLSFSEPIRNVPGADLVVFENALIALSDQGGAGIGGVFAELMHVEVSSDGVNWARFPSVSLTADPLGAFATIDPTDVYNLAGKHTNEGGESWGTPFDFATLASVPSVISGDVDTDAITHIRLIDIPGEGSQRDSLGNPIYDAYQTTGSGGADVDAVGVIGQSRSYDDWDAGRNLLPTADGDEDGIINLLEYAFDMDPAAPDKSLLPRMHVVDGQPELRFRRDVRNTDIIYRIESTTSLTNPVWTEVARAEAFANPTTSLPEASASIETLSRHKEASLDVWQEVCFRYKGLDEANPRRFFRVNVQTVTP